MGDVYLAEDTRLARKVAIKLLRSELTTDEHRVLRFKQEARAASALNHPNILTIYDIGEIDSLHFIVTEFVKGVTLRERISGAKMNLNEILNISIQAASALATAHEAGIVHRDVKPENIMLRPDGYVKVLDFGLAKLIERQAPSKDSTTSIATTVNTEPGLMIGTPKYMSPEQVRGFDVNQRSDIFSLGVVLYEMITGKEPFEGSTASDVIAAILQKDPAPIVQYSEETSRELQLIVSKALKKEVEERYQRIELLISDLKSLNQRLSKQAELKDPTQTDLSNEATLLMRGKRLLPRKHARKAIDSLAILPLVNASVDSSAEYLSDGITESIITNLSQLPKLKVMARSTVFRYKDKQADPQQVGRDLNVRAVLTGRVLLLSNRLIIRTELVDVLDGSQLWGEQYNRELSDIFAMEGEISKEISDKLRLKLTGEQRRRLAKRYTENTEAYQLYLKGRYFWNRFISQTLDLSDLKSAEELFQESIKIDPGFALAHSGLGVCYLNHVLKGIGGAKYYTKAKEAFDRALSIDPKLLEPRVRLIYIDLFEGRSEVARREIARLLRRAPNEPSVYAAAAYVYRLSGEYERAIELWDQLLNVSPTDVVFASTNRARIYVYQLDYEKAEAEINKGLAFESHHPLLLAYGAIIEYYRGNIEQARFILEDYLAKNPDLHSQKLFLALCYIAQDERERAFALIDEQVIEIAHADQDAAYRLATVYALDNQADKAIEWLERSISMGNENYPWFTSNPNWDALRSNERYKAIMEELKVKWEKLSK